MISASSIPSWSCRVLSGVITSHAPKRPCSLATAATISSSADAISIASFLVPSSLNNRRSRCSVVLGALEPAQAM